MRNNRRIVLISAWLFIVAGISAAPVSSERAIEVAQQFVPASGALAPGRGGQGGGPVVARTHPMPTTGEAAFYIVNTDNAFVLVSADDAAPQVLGYNIGTTWPTDEPIPSQVRYFLNSLAKQVEFVAGKGGTAESPEKAPKAAKTRKKVQRTAEEQWPDSVGPLLETTWHQKAGYSSLCPENPNGPGGHVYGGCVATAMAQIIRYWQFPAQGRGKHAYVSDYNGEYYGLLTVDYDSAAYNYSLMPRKLTAESTPEEIAEVARLIYHCGVSVNMDYSIVESGAYEASARAAFINHFHYNANCSPEVRSNYYDEEWEWLLRNDLAAGRPVMYSGYDDVGGHTFVCDGYKQDSLFHFNFGWSGNADGWYLSSVAGPENGYKFTDDQLAVFGLEPDTTGENVFIASEKGNSWFTLDEPAEYYHFCGHSPLYSSHFINEATSKYCFTSRDTTKHLVLDVLSFDYQTVYVYDSDTATQPVEVLTSDRESYPAVVSMANTLGLLYDGNMFNTGFCLRISPEEECRMVSNVESRVLNPTTVELTWKENGSATEWQVEYGFEGFTQGEGTLVTATDTSLLLNNITENESYDFYVRPACGGLWAHRKNVQAREKYWHEMVTEMPEGYLQDDENKVMYVSSAEGLAWVNVLNRRGIWDYKIELLADIDLGAYLWKPIEVMLANVDGHGHTISNLRILEGGNLSGYSDYAFINYFGAAFHSYDEGVRDTIANLFFQDPEVITLGGDCSDCTEDPDVVYGLSVVVAYPYGATIINCGVRGATLHQGYDCERQCVSALVGAMEDTEIINCYAGGNITSVVPYIGGLLGEAAGEDNALRNCYSYASPAAGLFVRADEETELTHCFVVDTIGSDALLTALNAWVDANNEDGKLYRWAADTENVNNGYPILVPNTSGQGTDLDASAGAEEVTKFIRNGQLFLRRANRTFNTLGVEVETQEKSCRH